MSDKGLSSDRLIVGAYEQIKPRYNDQGCRGWLFQFLRPGTLLLLAISVMACTTDDPQILEYRLDNGLWFNGETFEARTGYVENGLLRFSDRHHEAIKVIDLEGGFVAPPFCEGHNHNIGGAADGVESVVARYLKDGVFYAMMPGSFSYYREIIADKINTPSSVDVAFANNGLTGSGGHPSRLREMLMERYGNYPEFTKASLPDRGYFEANTLEELREKWNLILAEKPDFIKVMLLYAEEYEERKNDPAYYGSRGLDPALMPELVRLAQKEGLRVAVHVETDFDMATALRAGADIIAHLPSNSSPERISGETIALAKKTNAALVTTLSVAKRFQLRSPERYAATIDAQRENLRRLEHAGVKLVLGSDNVRDTSRGEAQHLASLGVLDNGTLLRMWTVNCARAVFPERKIGQLADGYEASFLVLENDPLLDFEHTRSIRLRMKDGEILELNDGFVER